MFDREAIEKSYKNAGMSESFACWERAAKVLAGPSTFSKGPGQFAYGVTPFCLESGSGAMVRDVDGREYLDYILGLGSNVLGYADPDFNADLGAQLAKGVSFSLTTRLEIEVAELLCGYVPCAELVRFAKNGSDVTSAAVRLARHVTGRDLVLFCGYHGWQNWYASQTSMSGGVPECEKANSVRFAFNDLAGLERLMAAHRGQVACVIMEPVYKVEPEPGYLEAVKALCEAHGALLIFDEVITGLRIPGGSAQKRYGVSPDLACFSKALGNGMPISALAGRRDIMRSCTSIYFSLTNAGETASLAAARHMLRRFEAQDCPGLIARFGERLMTAVRGLIADRGLNFVRLEGFPWRSTFGFSAHMDLSPDVWRTLWIQETSRRGVLNGGYHFLSLAHGEPELARTLEVYDEVLALLADLDDPEEAARVLTCPIAALSAREI